MSRYTAILFLVGEGSYSFTASRPLDLKDPKKIWSYFCHEFLEANDGNLDSIILMENGKDGSPPVVVANWSVKNGDF